MKCEKCKEKIEREEKYVRITDFDKGEKVKEIYLHIICWKNLFSDKIQEALKKKVKQVMEVIR